MMIDTNAIFDQAKRDYAAGKFDSVKPALDHLIEECGDAPLGLSARYLRGRGYEEGYFGGIDLKSAIKDFSVLTDHHELFGSDAPLSLARVFLAENYERHELEIARLCNLAIKSDGNVHAMMVLGRLNELLGRVDLAGQWYLAAFKGGLPWGMRYYARMHSAAGHRLRSLLAHAATSVSSPVLVFRNGIRSAFV